MKSVNDVQKKLSARRALTGIVAPGVLVFGMVALASCGDDDDDTPTDTVVDTIAPIDTMAPGDTVVTGETVTGETMAPVDTSSMETVAP